MTVGKGHVGLAAMPNGQRIRPRNPPAVIDDLSAGIRIVTAFERRWLFRKHDFAGWIADGWLFEDKRFSAVENR